MAHILMVLHSVTTLGLQALWIAVAAAAVLLLVHVRLLKPLSLRTRPWRVVEVRPEVERVWTLVLAAEGHPGLTFHPGQLVWLTLGETPLSIQQHPFSISSSAATHDRMELTIKELGDFTATMGEVDVGRKAFLEGPYGHFTCDLAPAGAPLVLVAGGIGITPMMSMLRTLADRGDRRRVVLLIAAS